MLTLSAIPRSFEGRFDTIQRNALGSWVRLLPKPEVLLLGDDAGTREAARAAGVLHIPDVRRNAGGTPLLSDLFHQAESRAVHPFVGYVNSDIVLLSDFAEAVRRLTAHPRPFLLVGRVWYAPVPNAIDFSKPDWELRFRKEIERTGAQAPPPGNSDFFVWPRGFWGALPDFAIGRGCWDGWLVSEARRRGADVIDASRSVMAVHQNHERPPTGQSLRVWRSEFQENLRLASDYRSRFSLWDATHLLDAGSLRRPRGLRYRIRAADTLSFRRPAWAVPAWPLRFLLAALRMGVNALRRNRNPLHRWVGRLRSELPPDAVPGLVGLSSRREYAPGLMCRGLDVAEALLKGGIPVVVHDSDKRVMREARERLSGPVHFAVSVAECQREATVLLSTFSSGTASEL